jgi:hypothetical protein
LFIFAPSHRKGKTGIVHQTLLGNRKIETEARHVASSLARVEKDWILQCKPGSFDEINRLSAFNVKI